MKKDNNINSIMVNNYTEDTGKYYTLKCPHCYYTLGMTIEFSNNAILLCDAEKDKWAYCPKCGKEISVLY